jgi:lipopolysaccharide export system permease protein
MRTLTRYIGRDVLAATFVVFAGLLMLFSFFDLIGELEDVGQGNYTILGAVVYVVLHLPSRAYELFPVSALIGTLFALSQHVVSSEFTVMRVSGASQWQVAWAVIRVGIPLAVATFLAGELVAPAAERLASTMRNAAKGDASRVVAQQFDSGFWFRQEQTFVNVRTVLADVSLSGVRIYEFGPDYRLVKVRLAEAGRFLKEGRWKLTNVQTTTLSGDGATTTTEPEMIWETVLRPSLLTVYQVAPERLELGTLYDNIRLMGGASKTTRFEIALWNKIFYPVAVLVMMVLALPFAQFQRRSGGMGMRIFTGTMLGLVFFMLGRMFNNLGVINDWPPLFAATFPLLLFTAIAFGLLAWIERR